MSFVKEPKLFLGDGVYIGEDKPIYFLQCGIWIPLLTCKEKLEFIASYLDKFYPGSEISKRYRKSLL